MGIINTPVCYFLLSSFKILQMNNTINKLSLIIALVAIAITSISLSACNQEECIQCTLRGTVTVCDDSIDVFNARHGTNAQSVNDVRTLVRTLGGTCSN